MADCVFCQILEGRAEGSVVYRDERAIVLLDLFPVREAHCLVIPVQHQPLLQDLEPDLCAHLLEQTSHDVDGGIVSIEERRSGHDTDAWGRAGGAGRGVGCV